MYEEIAKEAGSTNYSIIQICNGKISPFEKFQSFLKTRHPQKNIYYLYDFEGNIPKYVAGLAGYPHEFVFKEKEQVASFTGYNQESFLINKGIRLNFINSNINQ